MPPANVLTRAVPLELVIVRTDKVAVVVRNLVAYTDGIEFTLSIRLRPPRSVFPSHPLGLGPGGDKHRDDLLRFGVQFADGVKATTLQSFVGRRPDEEPRIWLSQNGGSGGAERWELGFWLWPLPPHGPLTFVVAWLGENVTETRAELDTGPIREAAAQAEVLWEPSNDGTAAVGTDVFMVGFDDELKGRAKPESD